MTKAGKLLMAARPGLLPLAALLFAGALLFWMSVRGLPNVAVVTVPGPSVSHRVSLDYQFGLSAGTLYPEGRLVGPERKAIPARLVEWGRLTVRNQLELQQAELEGGEYSLAVRVRAGELWSKAYPLLGPETMVAGATSIEATADLPLRTILSDIRRITEETGLGSPTGQHEMDILLTTRLRVQGQEALNHTYAPAFTFSITHGGLLLEAPEEMVARERFARDQMAERANTRPFLGRVRPVGEVKELAWYGLLATGLLAVAALGLRLAGGPGAPADPGRRYRDRLVRVTAIAGVKVGLSVRVRGLAELAKIADEAQAPLIELEAAADIVPAEFLEAGPTPELQGRRYLVVAGNTMFYAF